MIHVESLSIQNNFLDIVTNSLKGPISAITNPLNTCVVIWNSTQKMSFYSLHSFIKWYLFG